MSNEYDWRRWFAWRPVRLYVQTTVHDSLGAFPGGHLGEKVWLRWIERRHVGAVAPNGDLTDYWEYRRCAS
jgi:hypothetical protein